MRNLKEIVQHAIDGMNDKINEGQYKDDLHHVLFNEDYFIIGYYEASQFLKRNEIDPFDAIGYVFEQEEQLIGEINLRANDINSQKIVNLLAYYAGNELIYNLDSFDAANDRLTKKDIKAIIKELESLL